jgi:hypothetical protein
MKNQKKGSRFETKVSKTIGSGRLEINPLDLRYDKSKSEKYYIECKFTDLKGYRITLNLLEKIWGASLSLNKEPALVIGIRRNDDEVFVINCSIQLEKNRK